MWRAMCRASAREMRHHRLADAPAAEGWADEQILQIDAEPPVEGRIVEQPHRKADRHAVPFGEFAERARVRAEQRRIEHALGRGDFVTKLFVFGKLADE